MDLQCKPNGANGGTYLQHGLQWKNALGQWRHLPPAWAAMEKCIGSMEPYLGVLLGGWIHGGE
jgi:hypothetical protein